MGNSSESFEKLWQSFENKKDLRKSWESPQKVLTESRQTNKKKLLSFLINKNFKLIKIYNKSKLSKNIFQYDYFFKNTNL